MALRRPVGVSVIAVLTWVSATLHIVLGALVLANVLSASGVTDASAWVGIVVGVVTLLVSLGLFGGSNVARVLVTISMSFSVLTAVLLIVDDPAGLIAAPIVSGVVAVVGLLVLYTRSANRFFGSS
ncbi:MAG: hypothetical protein ABWX65_04725 [Mycetocola sp.]